MNERCTEYSRYRNLWVLNGHLFTKGNGNKQILIPFLILGHSEKLKLFST